MPGWPEQTVRLEAGAYRGRIVFFQTVNPWTQPTAMREEPQSRAQRWSRGFVAIVVLSCSSSQPEWRGTISGKGAATCAARSGFRPSSS